MFPAKRRIRKAIGKMRLIDADRLNEVIERNFASPDALKQIVDVQPTAYELDKVVEELEEYVYSDICCGCHRCRYIDEDNINCEQCGALGALEIIKKLDKNNYVNKH